MQCSKRWGSIGSRMKQCPVSARFASYCFTGRSFRRGRPTLIGHAFPWRWLCRRRRPSNLKPDHPWAPLALGFRRPAVGSPNSGRTKVPTQNVLGRFRKPLPYRHMRSRACRNFGIPYVYLPAGPVDDSDPKHNTASPEISISICGYADDRHQYWVQSACRTCCGRSWQKWRRARPYNARLTPQNTGNPSSIPSSVSRDAVGWNHWPIGMRHPKGGTNWVELMEIRRA